MLLRRNFFSLNKSISGLARDEYEWSGGNCRGKSGSWNTYGAGAPFWFGGERRMHKEQIEATHTHKDFTQLRAARVRKTLLLLVWIDSCSCSGAQEATVSLELDVDGCLLGLPLLRRMGLLLYAQG